MSARDQAMAAALGMVGTKFRLHGRNPAYGLDCVGVAGLAMRAAGCRAAVPAGYAVRGGTIDDILTLVDQGGLVRTGRPAPGDLLLFAAGAAQFHFAIKTRSGIVHADAMLRRVVERPGPAPWPLVAAWAPVDDAAVWDAVLG